MCYRYRRLTAFILCACLLFMQSPLPAQESKVTEDQVNAQATQVQQLIYEVEDYDRKANALNSQINALNISVQQMQLKYAQARNRRERYSQDLNDRARAMYMFDTGSMAEVLFSSESISDLLDNLEIVTEIARQDSETRRNLNDAVRAVSNTRKEVTALRDQLVTLKSENDNLLAQKRDALTRNQALYDQLMKQFSEEQEAERLRRQQEEMSAAARDTLESSEIVPLDELNAYLSSGYEVVEYTQQGLGWAWPLDASANGAFLITSLMGTRESPGGIGSTDHQGTDIAADYGTPIIAAESGTVTIAGSYGGYGNAVKIDHGVLSDGSYYTTLYGHMSTVAVAVGQTVTKGQVIGYEGSTGWSTGPHLHFEVTKDGSVVNGLAFYDDSILGRLSYNI